MHSPELVGGPDSGTPVIGTDAVIRKVEGDGLSSV